MRFCMASIDPASNSALLSPPARGTDNPCSSLIDAQPAGPADVPKEEVTRFQWGGQTYINCKTYADGSCALHALLGEKGADGVYHCPDGEGGISPREHFRQKLRNMAQGPEQAPSREQDPQVQEQITFPGHPQVQEKYLEVIKDFVMFHAKNWGDPRTPDAQMFRANVENRLQRLSSEGQGELAGALAGALAALYPDWNALVDGQQNNFLLRKTLLDLYLFYINTSSYYFGADEILLQASMYNVNVWIFAKNPSQTDDVPIFLAGTYDGAGGEGTVYVYQGLNHFSRCYLETFPQKMLRILSDIISKIINWISSLSGRAGRAVRESWRRFCSNSTPSNGPV